MKTLHSALAVLAIGLGLDAHDSQAVLIFATDAEEARWYVGQPPPTIDVGMPTDRFVAMACGAELAWVSDNFPSLPMRKFGSSADSSECVMWRGDNARFIVDNIKIAKSRAP